MYVVEVMSFFTSFSYVLLRLKGYTNPGQAAPGEEEIFADDVATVAQTIGYELVCGITKRVPRVYMRGGKVEKIHYGIPHEEA